MTGKIKTIFASLIMISGCMLIPLNAYAISLACPIGYVTCRTTPRTCCAPTASQCDTLCGIIEIKCGIGQYRNSIGGCSQCPEGYRDGADALNENSCIGNFTKTGSQVNGSVPSGCASVTSWNACTPGTCRYQKNYAGTITSDCTPTNCTKTPAAVTAKANYYVSSSGTSCPACSSYSSTHTLSDGGNISSAYCYRNATKTGSQVNGSVPSGCASVTSWNACTPGTCTYKDYYSATDTTCTPTNCTKTPAAVTAKTNYYVSGTTCPACPSGYPNSAGGNIGQNMCYMTSSEQPISGGTNVPVSNTVYYGNTCTYTTQCHDGYNQTGTNTCSQLCQLGITRLRTTSGITVPLYSEKLSTPSLNIGIDGGVCYGILSSGNGGITIRYNDQTYHVVE